MARARFKVTYSEPAWLKMIRDEQRPVAEAAVAALRETSANAVQEGRVNIAAAGPGFTHAQWVSGLQYRTKDAKKGDEASLQARSTIFHRYGIAGVFEFGANIAGKPMLWIPTRRGAPRASKSGKKLTAATVGGTPMLFDADDPDRNRKPLYIGVRAVRIPKKFSILAIVRRNYEKLGQLFLKHFKGN